MRHGSRSIVLGFATAALLALPPVATAASAVPGPPAESTKPAIWEHVEAGFDATVLRPLGFIALVFGGAFVVPIALVTWPFGPATTENAVDQFITTPAEDLFYRPLGEF